MRRANEPTPRVSAYLPRLVGGHEEAVHAWAGQQHAHLLPYDAVRFRAPHRVFGGLERESAREREGAHAKRASAHRIGRGLGRKVKSKIVFSRRLTRF